jgi:hypothetical protein
MQGENKEISLCIGERIDNIEGKNNDWWYGHKEGLDGDCGWFPGNLTIEAYDTA